MDAVPFVPQRTENLCPRNKNTCFFAGDSVSYCFRKSKRGKGAFFMIYHSTRDES